MIAVVRCVTLISFLALSIACNSDRPTAPSSLPTPPTSTVQPPPTAGLPTLSGPADIYLFSERLSYAIRDYTVTSKYALHDNGAFSLQYPSIGGEYVGTYRKENGAITFRFSADSRWDATGTLNGDSLEVRYNLIMEMSDFENAVYKRSQ